MTDHSVLSFIGKNDGSQLTSVRFQGQTVPNHYYGPDMNPQDETWLIRQFKAGDLSTFEIIIKKYQDRIYNLCRYLLGHPQDAEDAAQDVFIKGLIGI